MVDESPDSTAPDAEKQVAEPCCACPPPEEHIYPDGGYGWVVVGCCTTLCALTNGWGMIYGVFQEVSVAGQGRNVLMAVLCQEHLPRRQDLCDQFSGRDAGFRECHSQSC